ncbi:hypothetical protein SAMN04489764_2802 [Thermostaphylospora chromogena]|uniref:Uncharacterized protein n=1 Tax=Thermostaphylospora chromogena TaxID=35622 RepID=A0A1H1F5J9_9ACTN|nr:hypothetical protein SAMN04489764_2802 [Thermostaphylospora chromogena]
MLSQNRISCLAPNCGQISSIRSGRSAPSGPRPRRRAKRRPGTRISAATVPPPEPASPDLISPSDSEKRSPDRPGDRGAAGAVAARGGLRSPTRLPHASSAAARGGQPALTTPPTVRARPAVGAPTAAPGRIGRRFTTSTAVVLLGAGGDGLPSTPAVRRHASGAARVRADATGRAVVAWARPPTAGRRARRGPGLRARPTARDAGRRAVRPGHRPHVFTSNNRENRGSESPRPDPCHDRRVARPGARAAPGCPPRPSAAGPAPRPTPSVRQRVSSAAAGIPLDPLPAHDDERTTTVSAHEGGLGVAPRPVKGGPYKNRPRVARRVLFTA